MTAPKHTPGPWRFNPYYSFEKKRDVPNRYNGIYEPIPGQEFGSKSRILTVGIKGDVDDYWIHCSDANARLIAAAPDLLEALHALLSAIDQESLECLDDAIVASPPLEPAKLAALLNARDAASAAIAKAEGNAE